MILSWIKSNSPVNLGLFPGQKSLRGLSTYRAEFPPLAEPPETDGGDGDEYNVYILWTPDYTKPKKAKNDSTSVRHSEDLRSLLPVLHVARSSSLNPTQYCVIFAHGNYVDLGEVCELAVLMSVKLQADVIVPEYPGYGEYPGFPSMDSVDAAVRSASILATQVMKVPADRILVMGHSVGTGPAAALAEWMTKNGQPPRLLILHSPYESVRKAFKSFVGIIGNITFERWNIASALEGVGSPSLLLHGDKDHVIPYQHSLTLQQGNYPHPCHLETLPDFDHGDWDKDLETFVVNPIGQFLNNYFNLRLSTNFDSSTGGLECRKSEEFARLVKQGELVVTGIRTQMPPDIENRNMPSKGRLFSRVGKKIVRGLSLGVAATAGAPLGSSAAFGRSVHESLFTPSEGHEISDSEALKTTRKILQGLSIVSGATAAIAPGTAPVLGPLGASCAVAGKAVQQCLQ